MFLTLYSPVSSLEEKSPSEFLHLYLDMVLSGAPSITLSIPSDRRPPAFIQLLLPLCLEPAVLPFLSLWLQLLQQPGHESHTPPAFLLRWFFFAGFWLSTDFSSQESSHFAEHDKQRCSFHWEFLETSSAPAAQSPRASLKAAAEGWHPFFPSCSSQRSLI